MPKIIRKLKVIDLEKPDLSQSRVGTDPETIAKYKAAWESEEADFFPPIVVYQDGEKYHIADGFHRVQSLMLANLEKKLEYRTIACEIYTGTLQDAITYSLSANLKHGLLPSTADKKRAILLYYGLSAEHCAHSNNAVAKACGCSHTFVGAWKTTCLTMPASITAAETKIPIKILEQTIANLKAAAAEGKIVTTRGGKELIQSEKISSKAPETNSRKLLQGERLDLISSSKALTKTYIFTNPHDVIPRGKIISGFESLTDPGHISIEWEGKTLLIWTTDAIEIPFDIGSKVSPIGEEIELTVEGYSLVASDLKVRSTDLAGFAHTYSSTELESFVKKTLEIAEAAPIVPENDIGAEEPPSTPILNLTILTNSQLRDLQVSIESELRRRGSP